jgi:hypothetical protein
MINASRLACTGTAIKHSDAQNEMVKALKQRRITQSP